MRYGRLATLSFALLVALVAVTSGSPVYAATGGQHRRHHPQQQRRHSVVFFEGRYLGAVVQHPGSRLAIRWIAVRGSVAGQTRRAPVELSAALVGPYGSLSALKQAQLRRHVSAPVAMAVIHVRPGSTRSISSALTVPRRARHGYYRLTLRAVAPSAHREITFVIEIKAR